MFNSGNDVLLDDVYGDHIEGKTNLDVGGLVVHDQFLKHIPSNLAEFFPYLIAMELKDANLISLSSGDFKPFPNLMIFISFHNSLVKLDGDLFMFTPKVRWISFYDNFLQHVGQDLLKNLTELEFAGFDKNPCTTLYAETPEEIAELKIWLPVDCPTLPETLDLSTLMSSKAPEAWHDKNFELLEFIIQQNEKLSLEFEELKAKVSEQETAILQFYREKEKQDLKIQQLENRLSNLNENPIHIIQTLNNVVSNICQRKYFKNICQIFS